MTQARMGWLQGAVKNIAAAWRLVFESQPLSILSVTSGPKQASKLRDHHAARIFDH